MTPAKSALLAGCLGLAVLASAAPAPAQLLPGAVTGETMARALLGPGAWLLNYPAGSSDNLTGNAILTFQAGGEGLTVSIRNVTASVSCEKPVTVTPEGIAFDGCREAGIVLRFTPQDPVFAFRGASAQRWYTLRPHR
jgi:hypothetical protein